MIAVGGVTWPVVTLLGVILLVVCFLAVLWSKREWNSRSVRIGMFLEREYRIEDEEEPDEDTAIIPPPEPPDFVK